MTIKMDADQAIELTVNRGMTLELCKYARKKGLRAKFIGRKPNLYDIWKMRNTLDITSDIEVRNAWGGVARIFSPESPIYMDIMCFGGSFITWNKIICSLINPQCCETVVNWFVKEIDGFYDAVWETLSRYGDYS